MLAGAADVTAAAVATPRASSVPASALEGQLQQLFLQADPALRKRFIGWAVPIFKFAPRCSNVGTSLIPDVPMLISEAPCLNCTPPSGGYPDTRGSAPVPRPAGQRQPVSLADSGARVANLREIHHLAPSSNSS